MLDVHVGRRGRGRRLVQERQVINRDRARDERDQEDQHETEVRAACRVELVEDQAAYDQAAERRDRRQPRAMRKVSAAPAFGEIARFALPYLGIEAGASGG